MPTCPSRSGPDIEDRAEGTRRSSVPQRWERATEAALAELMAPDLSGLEVAVVMVDGIEVAGQCCVATWSSWLHGTKVPVGVWLGGTGDETVVTSLLADHVSSGLTTEAGLLVVIDAVKALDDTIGDRYKAVT